MVALMCTHRLNSFDPEAEGRTRGDVLPPLHVSWLSDSFLLMFFLSGLTGVDRYHLLVHVLMEGKSKFYD